MRCKKNSRRKTIIFLREGRGYLAKSSKNFQGRKLTLYHFASSPHAFLSMYIYIYIYIYISMQRSKIMMCENYDLLVSYFMAEFMTITHPVTHHKRRQVGVDH